MKCPNCHTRIADNATQCWLCGYNIYDDTVEEIQENEIFENYQTEIYKSETDNNDDIEAKLCPFCGEKIAKLAKKCKHCGEWLNKSLSNSENNTQQLHLHHHFTANKKTARNSINNKFNWGAFLFGWIWAIRYKPLFALVDLLLLILLPFTLGILCLVFRIYLGLNGNKIAWESREYRNAVEFHDIQKRWVVVWGIIQISLFFISLVISCIVFNLINHNDKYPSINNEKLIDLNKFNFKQKASNREGSQLHKTYDDGIEYKEREEKNFFEDEDIGDSYNNSTNTYSKVTQDTDLNQYVNEMQAKIKENWNTPQLSQGSYKVVFLMQIAKNGNLLSCRVKESSGSAQLDNSGLIAIELTAPFKPLPDSFDGKSIDVEFSFLYDGYGIE